MCIPLGRGRCYEVGTGMQVYLDRYPSMFECWMKSAEVVPAKDQSTLLDWRALSGFADLTCYSLR